MDVTLSFEQIKRWGVKGGIAILDQGLYSGANFLLGILLARWISPEMYGGFSAAYSIFFLFSTFQVALIAEPMSIFGANRYGNDIISYLNYLLRIQWVGALLGAFLFILFALLFTSDVLRESIIAMAVSLPLILHYWYLRRAFYIKMQSDMAMITSFIYSISLILLIFSIQFFGYMSPLAAYLSMALSSLVTSFFAMKRLDVSFWGKSAVGIGINPKAVNKELWNFGKWVLPAYLAGWFSSLSFPFFISVLINTQSAGAFRAMQNLFLPFQQFLAAITLLILPWLAKQKLDNGSRRLFALTQISAGVTGLTSLIYCFFIVIFRNEIVVLLYANSFYSSFNHLVIFLAISTLIGAAPLILGLALRILDQPSKILLSKGCAAIFTIFIGLPMIWIFRMDGVIFTLVSSTILEAVILLISYLYVKSSVKSLYQPWHT